MPSDVFNCEYFDDLKRKLQDPHFPEAKKVKIRNALKDLPEGYRILAWTNRPIKEGPHNVLTMEKFDE